MTRVYYDSVECVVARDDRPVITSPNIDTRQEYVRRYDLSGLSEKNCLVCHESLRKVRFENKVYLFGWDEKTAVFAHCGLCGWWSIRSRHYQDWSSYPSSDGPYVHWPILKEMSTDAAEIPVGLIREYLTRHYSDICLVSDKKAEELVRSVLQDVYPGCDVAYFSGGVYEHDQGIDLVVVNSKGGRFGVQVKRRLTKKAEPVEAVDRFVTALFKNGMVRGVYVTLASHFSRYAKQVPMNSYLRSLGLELSLIDASRFYEFLRELTRTQKEPVWWHDLRNYEGCDDQQYIDDMMSAFQARFEKINERVRNGDTIG